MVAVVLHLLRIALSATLSVHSLFAILCSSDSCQVSPLGQSGFPSQLLDRRWNDTADACRTTCRSCAPASMPTVFSCSCWPLTTSVTCPQPPWPSIHPPTKSMMVAADSAGGAAAAGALGLEDDEVLEEDQLQEVDTVEDADDVDDEQAAAKPSAAAAGGSEPPRMVERQLGESKKAATARRQELLGSGQGSFSAALLSVL